MGAEAFTYRGKRTLVVGGASGMGAATAGLLSELGAEVIVADFARVPFRAAQSIKVDLREPASIDSALDGLDEPIHALFSCAGVADESTAVKVNFLGQRYLIESMVQRDLFPRGSAVGVVSSTAGYGWETNLKMLNELLDTGTFSEGVTWAESHPSASNYVLSKRAMCAYVARQGFPLLKRGIRINAILPGPTDTPLARANADTWLAAGNEYREAVSVAISKPEDQAYVLAFLCSPAASGMTATNVMVDYGLVSARLLHGFPPPLSQ